MTRLQQPVPHGHDPVDVDVHILYRTMRKKGAKWQNIFNH